MSNKQLRIAIDRYDRHIPLFMGQVAAPSGWEIEYLEVGMDPPRRDGVDRHRRMLVNREFDAAEVSLASYLVAREQGMEDMIALPVFPRRLFSQNHIFVGSRSGIEQPLDLAGRRVAIWAFQVTMSVLAKGDLKRDFGLNWEDIIWMAENPEEISHDYGSDVRIERLSPQTDVVQALRTGEIDACINPHPPEPMMTPGNGVDRLFPDWQEATFGYFKRYGYFPIMHVLVIKTEHLQSDPSLGTALVQIFDEAKSMARQFYVDPGYSMVMHTRNTLEYEFDKYSADTWPSGLDANRQNLLDFIAFCKDQRLITRTLSPEEVFHV